MRRRSSPVWGWAPAWVLVTGVAMLALGLVLLGAGVVADRRGWWEQYPFTTNVVSSLATALVGAPVSVLLLSYVVAQVDSHRRTDRSEHRLVSALSALRGAAAYALRGATASSKRGRLLAVEHLAPFVESLRKGQSIDDAGLDADAERTLDALVAAHDPGGLDAMILAHMLELLMAAQAVASAEGVSRVPENLVTRIQAGVLALEDPQLLGPDERTRVAGAAVVALRVLRMAEAALDTLALTRAMRTGEPPQLDVFRRRTSVQTSNPEP